MKRMGVTDWRLWAAIAACLFSVGMVMVAANSLWSTSERTKSTNVIADQFTVAKRDAKVNATSLAAVRKSRDEAVGRAAAANREKVTIDCATFDRANGFSAIVASIIAPSPTLTPEQRAMLEPFTLPLPHPAECP